MHRTCVIFAFFALVATCTQVLDAAAQSATDPPALCSPSQAQWRAISNGSDIDAMRRVSERTPTACRSLRQQMGARIERVSQQLRANIIEQERAADDARRRLAQAEEVRRQRDAQVARELELAQADDRAFASAQSINTVAAFGAYLSSHPTGRHSSDARESQKKLAARELASRAVATGIEGSWGLDMPNGAEFCTALMSVASVNRDTAQLRWQLWVRPDGTQRENERSSVSQIIGVNGNVISLQGGETVTVSGDSHISRTASVANSMHRCTPSRLANGYWNINSSNADGTRHLGTILGLMSNGRQVNNAGTWSLDGDRIRIVWNGVGSISGRIVGDKLVGCELIEAAGRYTCTAVREKIPPP